MEKKSILGRGGGRHPPLTRSRLVIHTHISKKLG